MMNLRIFGLIILLILCISNVKGENLNESFLLEQDNTINLENKDSLIFWDILKYNLNNSKVPTTQTKYQQFQNWIHSINEYLDGNVDKGLNSVFLTIATIAGGLLALLFTITNIHISSIKNNFNINLDDFKKEGKWGYIGLCFTILINLLFFLIIYNFNYTQCFIWFICFSFILLTIIFVIIWNDFTKLFSSGVEDLINNKFKKYKSSKEKDQINYINDIYELLNYSCNKNTRIFKLGMEKFSYVVGSVNNYKLQRKLFKDFSNLILKDLSEESREIIKLYKGMGQKTQERILNQIESQDFDFVHGCVNMDFISAKLKELSKKTINKDDDLDRAIIGYATMQEINKLNIQIVKLSKSNFYLIKNNIFWSIGLISRLILKPSKLEYYELELIFLCLFINFNDLKKLTQISELNNQTEEILTEILCSYEKYADIILSQETLQVDIRAKRHIISSNINHFYMQDILEWDNPINEKINELHSKYSFRNQN